MSAYWKICFLINAYTNIVNGFESKVIGGAFSSINEFPHSAFLTCFCGDSQYWICGSSILTQNVLLTAGHCLSGCEAKRNIDAFVGNENLHKVKIIRKLTRIMLHEQYNDVTLDHDIALAKINKNLPLGTLIKRVIIPAKPIFAKDAIIAGWGVTSDGGAERSIKLKSVKQKMKDSYSCARHSGKVKDGVLCATNPSRTDFRPAEGDSGSALITPDGYQIGLVSFNIAKRPEIVFYTDTNYYYNWIREGFSKLSCSYE